MHGHAKTGERTATYLAWRNMKDRCYNPNYEGYANYGGRGITVCAEWKDSFETFLQDMGERPERIDALSLDRIDNNKGYYKENCRWATWKEQRANQNFYEKRSDNTSGVTGVCWDKKPKRWKVQVREGARHKLLYWGEDFEEACRIRKLWEEERKLK